MFRGAGHFGEVMLGTMVADGRKVAVKTCKPNVPDPGRFLEEADVLKEYDHPNIVQLIGVVSSTPIYIILELCLGGELLDFLRKKGANFDVGMYVRMSLEGGEGMAYLHERFCIHRDLAARNCLVTDDGVVKISDFGMSRVTAGDEDLYEVDTTARTIPIKWTAPEVLTDMVYFLATDIWAFGKCDAAMLVMLPWRVLLLRRVSCVCFASLSSPTAPPPQRAHDPRAAAAASQDDGHLLSCSRRHRSLGNLLRWDDAVFRHVQR